MNRLRRNIAAGTLLALVLAGGCGAESVPEAGTDNREIAARTGPSFVARLALLPRSLVEDSDEVFVQMADLDRAAGLAGAGRPPDATDEDAVWAYLRAVAGEPGVDGERTDVAALLPLRVEHAGSARVHEFDAELGWSVVDVDWYVEWPNPEKTTTVVGGGLDQERLTAAMGESDGGVWQLGDTTRAPDLTSATAARPQGEPLWLELADGYLTVANDRDAFEDIRTGAATLAEIPALRALAEAMDVEQAYSALLRLGAPGQDQLLPKAAQETLREWLLEPYLGVAAGLAHDGDQPYVVLGYAHDDAATAEANAEQIRGQIERGRNVYDRPWSGLLAAEEIRVDGTTVVARLAVREFPIHTAYDLLRDVETLTFRP